MEQADHDIIESQRKMDEWAARGYTYGFFFSLRDKEIDPGMHEKDIADFTQFIKDAEEHGNKRIEYANKGIFID